MCYDHDSRPPIPPIAGGALDARKVELDAADGNHFEAYLAKAAEPSGAGIVILPDVRGLHAFFEDLALRFAENGIDAIAIDYFGRTAGIGDRGPGFEYQEHLPLMTFDGNRADIDAAIDTLRDETGVDRVYTVGFCMGGRLSFLSGTFDKNLAGVIGFYGWPVGAHRTGSPAPADVAAEIESPVLAIFGGADEGIQPAMVESFETALDVAAVPHKVIVYPNAPHSFFDRKSDEFSTTSAKAWDEVLGFIRGGLAA